MVENSNRYFLLYIIHRSTIPGKHRQLVNLDSRCAILGANIMKAINTDELRTGETSSKWKARLTQLIKILNKPEYLKQAFWNKELPENFGQTSGSSQKLL